MSTKALSCFFLFLTILNVPVMAFYLAGNDSPVELETMTDLFALTSMGNVGQTGFACNGIDMTVAYEKTYRAIVPDNSKAG